MRSFLQNALVPSTPILLQAKFNSIWVHPAVCIVRADKLVFLF